MMLSPVVSPRVTVICCFLNAAAFLREAVESVLAQDFGGWELLLVDDGSTDDGPAIARDFAAADPGRIRVLHHPGRVNRGASRSRNLALAQAKSEFIAFIDADDVWRPHKLSQQVAAMEAHAQVGMLCGRVNYWSSWNGGPDRLVQTGLADKLLFPPEALLELYPLGRAPAPCPSDIMLRRSVVEAVGGFEQGFEGPVQLYEDQAFFAKLYLETPVYFSPRVWLDYRQHEDSCVSVSHRQGGYTAMRGHFLDWLAAYVAERPVGQRQAAEAAIRRARWSLAYPLAAKVGRRLRSALAIESTAVLETQTSPNGRRLAAESPNDVEHFV